MRQTVVECKSATKTISVFDGENNEVTRNEARYGRQTICGRNGCSVQFDNRKPCKGCINGKVNIVHNLQLGETFITCKDNAKFECDRNDLCSHKKWYSYVVMTTPRAVSRVLPHIHPCLIYEAIMRHIRDKYEAIMKQISPIFSKNEVLGPAFLFTTKPL